MYDMNSGYNGYKMSNRASQAYDNGEKPLSKWTKEDIIDGVKVYSKENKVPFTMSVLMKAPKSVLVELVLSRSSWHHTSSYANKTDFYSIDEYALDKLTDERVNEAIAQSKRFKKEEPIANRYKGTIKYLEWSGTKKHPKATECELKDVFIEEKGCFYIVTSETGTVLLKKKIGSNGTHVIKNKD